MVPSLERLEEPSRPDTPPVRTEAAEEALEFLERWSCELVLGAWTWFLEGKVGVAV